MTKACRVRTCPETAKRGQLMCRDHWFAVPRPLRTAINRTWRDHEWESYLANIRTAERLILEEEAARG